MTRLRLAALSALLAIPLAACSPDKAGPELGRADASGAKDGDPLAAVVQGEWRSVSERDEDAWRQPLTTLRFLGLRPGMTVAEFWPGAGGQSQILAPYLARTRGRFYAVHPEPGVWGAQGETLVLHYRRRLGSSTALYGEVYEGRFGPGTSEFVPAGTADLIVFQDRLHHLMAAGLAEKAAAEAFAALAPGGLLGIVQLRAEPGGPQDPLARDDRVQEDYVKALFREAGFVLEARSELSRGAANGLSPQVWMVHRFRKPSGVAGVLSEQQSSISSKSRP